MAFNNVKLAHKNIVLWNLYFSYLYEYPLHQLTMPTIILHFKKVKTKYQQHIENFYLAHKLISWLEFVYSRLGFTECLCWSQLGSFIDKDGDQWFSGQLGSGWLFSIIFHLPPRTRELPMHVLSIIVVQAQDSHILFMSLFASYQ